MSQQQKMVIDAWLDRGVGVICLSLVLAISYSLAEVTWLVLDGPKEPMVKMVEPIAIDQQMSAVTNISMAAIRRWHLFGEVGKQAPTPQPSVNKKVDAPATSLRLELNGVFRAEKEIESSAIVAEKGKEGKLYKVGDVLPGNATLETVYEDRIILNRNGRLETLHFPKISNTGLAAADKNDARNSSRKSSRRSSTARSSDRNVIKNPKSRLGNLVNEGRMPSPGELVSSINSDAQTDAGAALKELGFEPVAMADGGGYRVGSQAPMEMLQSIGLRQDDKVLSVNGQQLGDIEKDKYMFEQLATSCEGDVRVEIERGPRRFTVNVPCM